MSTQPTELVPGFAVEAKGCESRVILDHITGRWGTLILLALHEGPMRFSEIRRSIEGINEKALAQSLKHFERDGIVDRLAPEDGYPSRVEYRLTEVGAGLERRLRELVLHLYEEMPKVLDSHAEYDARRPS
ncbi:MULTISPECIES: winged helix-turn-helix transcriptional regulator [Glycomyces]|uniref:DNA-binding HxlR family transcriptional regulator n=2 Tax=Glycomyces TaxID=58113 RepID=A0A9X3PQL7_9ACTN|nr:helix-turn-helix domain-containing protein [Glycomyces lechevalierae]MDA1388219.1 helix-turn-helix domain-containing protein [Glycomyces lechevalierae]MDR7337338.1 DNA-binding HxlR family transcriptional regulator [Glycomyces lechevalierae]